MTSILTERNTSINHTNRYSVELRKANYIYPTFANNDSNAKLNQQHKTTTTNDSPQCGALNYQHKHALHKLRRHFNKRNQNRDLVISFVPRLKLSIINNFNFFHRYSEREKQALSCFNFLDDLIKATNCDISTIENSIIISNRLLLQEMIGSLK